MHKLSLAAAWREHRHILHLVWRSRAENILQKMLLRVTFGFSGLIRYQNLGSGSVKDLGK
jgi:hypothetical protein